MKCMGFTLAIGLLALALSGPAIAERGEEGLGDRPPPPRGGERDRPPPPPPPPILLALDLDDDGELSADEIAKAVESLKKADKNSDGKLSGNELHPPRHPRGRGGPIGPPPREGREGPRGRRAGPGAPGGPPPRGEDREGDRPPPPRRGEGPPPRGPRPERESI